MQCGHVSRVRTLYKAILKLHRGMTEELKILGDNYVKDEFRRHKSCTPEEATLFMNEWANYALQLATQLGLQGPKSSKPLGNPLDLSKIDSMTDEQVYQLYELMLASQGQHGDDDSKS